MSREKPQDDFQDYARVFAHVLDLCCDDVLHRPDAAVWNARRAAESLARAALERCGAKKTWTDQSELKDLETTLEVHFSKTRKFIEPLRERGNSAAHARKWSDAPHGRTLDSSARR